MERFVLQTIIATIAMADVEKKRFNYTILQKKRGIIIYLYIYIDLHVYCTSFLVKIFSSFSPFFRNTLLTKYFGGKKSEHFPIFAPPKGIGAII